MQAIEFSDKTLSYQIKVNEKLNDNIISKKKIFDLEKKLELVVIKFI